MLQDLVSRLQEFMAEQFGYEVCRWQVIVVCGLLIATILISAGTYIKNIITHSPKTIVAKSTAAKRSSDSPSYLFVYVCGSVAQVGVYQLKPGARAADAVGAAGGFSADADASAINLAKPITDGEKLFVPRVSSSGPSGSGSSSNSGSTSNSGNSNGSGYTPDSEPVSININTASIEELDSLPGIGPTIAQRIVTYRDKHGPFTTVDKLTDVEGIGEHKFNDIKDKITI